MSFEQLHVQQYEELTGTIDEICDEFEVTQEKLKELTDYFIEQMEQGLSADIKEALPMIPSFVTSRPTGNEKGVLLAADLGGTNFRMCKVTLNGDNTFSIIQTKSKIPEYLFNDENATSKDLFSFLAERVGGFLRRYFHDVFTLDEGRETSFRMGFTFSYPVYQTSLDCGELIRWTKGFCIKDTIGKDVVQLLQDELDERGLGMVNVVALTNDTVGTFLSLCYSVGSSEDSEGKADQIKGDITEPAIGCIFGTGTNGCYMEEISNIKKLPQDIKDSLMREGKTHMVINTEWGSFDNSLRHLPSTKYDKKIDENYSSNPGFHLFEKRVSGMFLGEILRTILIDLHSRGLILQQYRTYAVLPHRLKTPFELSCQILSRIEIDTTTGLRETELSLLQSLRLPTTPTERQCIQKLVRAISKRSAFLAAVPIAAIIIKTKILEKRYNGEVEVGCDGSIIEYYPGFRTMVRHALAMSPLGPEGERRIHLKISKDGSGVGAALCALMA